MKKMKCNNCGQILDLGNLHKDSLPVPDDEKDFYVLCVDCAGVESPGSKHAGETWIVEVIN